jgi:hypothetical protein
MTGRKGLQYKLRPMIKAHRESSTSLHRIWRLRPTFVSDVSFSILRKALEETLGEDRRGHPPALQLSQEPPLDGGRIEARVSSFSASDPVLTCGAERQFLITPLALADV